MLISSSCLKKGWGTSTHLLWYVSGVTGVTWSCRYVWAWTHWIAWSLCTWFNRSPGGREFTGSGGSLIHREAEYIGVNSKKVVHKEFSVQLQFSRHLWQKTLTQLLMRVAVALSWCPVGCGWGLFFRSCSQCEKGHKWLKNNKQFNYNWKKKFKVSSCKLELRSRSFMSVNNI